MARKTVRTEQTDAQLLLPFGPLRNKEFLSNHWLEHRLSLEPEWRELQDHAKNAAERLVALWKVERTRVEKYGNEAGLEQKFIQPVFDILGWHLKYQTFLQGREPDYALFLDGQSLDLALDAGRASPDFWSPATLVADAKAWHISLDRPTRVGGRREYPPEQIEWYLDRSRRDYGILTNGRLWRLVPRELGPNKPRFQTYLEVDLVHLLDTAMRPSAQLQLGPGGKEFATFLTFFLLFSPWAFRSIAERKPLIVRAVQGSSEYSLGVSEELKERVFEALRLCVEGFIKHKPNKLDPARDLAACQEHSFVFLYRLLFIMYGEDRGLLPYRINSTYTQNRSLARHRDEVATKLDNIQRGLDKQDYSRTETRIWDDLQTLFDLIDRGHQRYSVPAYNGGLFNLEGDSFLAANVLPDWYLARVLDQLGRAPQPDGSASGLFRVDYRDLAIQQLGSVYEGLLELRPRYADQPMAVIRTRQGGIEEEKIVPAADPLPRGYERSGIIYDAGTIYLATDKGQRRSTGSYYTPDHIVNHIVESALGDMCSAINRQLEQEVSDLSLAIDTAKPSDRAALKERLEQLCGHFDDRILDLRILDPAMGSGHFLIRACQYLAEEIATNPHTSDPAIESMQSADSTITYWKRKVAESCLYGVDINPMAVELAKLALWLETVAADAPLTFLDHHLRPGDSLIGARITWLNSLPGEGGLLEGQFEHEVETALPGILDPLREIGAIPSDTAANVKRKEQIFQRRFVPALRRFTETADLWCASLLFDDIDPISRDDYAALLQALNSKKQFDAKVSEPWAQTHLVRLRERNVRCFHWELEFPQVFLNERANGQRWGFDVVIGNPPYDVLSEKESGENVLLLKKLVEHDPSLAPSRVGKNNLYKLFICRAYGLLRDGGIFSFIVPMPLLGDEQASGVRKMLLGEGAFRQIHAFPQKDNPARRVFRDAKLSTALFVYQKGAEKDGTPGICRLHPAQYIEPDSPSLSLTSSAVGLYDPTNLTIVSCTQDDWDLATRIVRQPGIGRLGRFCVSYQGEVNETTDKRHLSERDSDGRQLVLRGANVCLYAVRDASQGQPLYIDPAAFRDGKRPDSKAFHGLAARVGFQRSSPQNNFRRLIAAHVPAGELCFDTISYIPSDNSSRVPPNLLLALLNSKLLDWYFRLGSTNSKVNEYQFNNLPCPIFRDHRTPEEDALSAHAASLLASDPQALPDALASGWSLAPFSPVIRDSLEGLVARIETLESARGEITRNQRSQLCAEAQVYQDVIDAILFRMAGLNPKEIAGIEDRLARML